MTLCKCTNCECIYINIKKVDRPIEYMPGLEELFAIRRLPTIILEDGTMGYGCPECFTDGYLQDNINPFAGEEA